MKIMKKKRIMSINMNDVGGKNEHLMSHRYFNNRDRNTVSIGSIGRSK